MAGARDCCNCGASVPACDAKHLGPCSGHSKGQADWQPPTGVATAATAPAERPEGKRLSMHTLRPALPAAGALLESFPVNPCAYLASRTLGDLTSKWACAGGAAQERTAQSRVGRQQDCERSAWPACPHAAPARAVESCTGERCETQRGCHAGVQPANDRQVGAHDAAGVQEDEATSDIQRNLQGALGKCGLRGRGQARHALPAAWPRCKGLHGLLRSCWCSLGPPAMLTRTITHLRPARRGAGSKRPALGSPQPAAPSTPGDPPPSCRGGTRIPVPPQCCASGPPLQGTL